MTALAAHLETHRRLLGGVAYRMLGSAAEAEDVLQEAWLRVKDVPEASVASPKAFLVRTVSRLCLDQLKSARVQRERYVGPWLPEPLVTDEPGPDDGALAIAYLVMLERLTASERVVLVLREALDLDHAALAEATGKSEAACRQLLSRAKRKLRDAEPDLRVGPRVPPAEARRQADAFMAALAQGDAEALRRILSGDVVWTSDGGGKATASRIPLVGPEAVLRLALGLGRQAREAPGAFTADPAWVNGLPGWVVRAGGRPLSVLAFEAGPDGIARIWAVLNPDKLRQV